MRRGSVVAAVLYSIACRGARMEENEGSTRIHRRIDGMIRGVKTGRVDVETAVFVIIEGIAEAKAIKEMQNFLGMAPKRCVELLRIALSGLSGHTTFAFPDHTLPASRKRRRNNATESWNRYMRQCTSCARRRRKGTGAFSDKAERPAVRR